MAPQNGEAIRAVRRAAKRTQVQIAAAAGIDQSYLSLLEADQRAASDEVIEAIAKALGVPAEILRRTSQEQMAS